MAAWPITAPPVWPGWKRSGFPVAAERIIVTASAQHGLAICLGALLRPGDLLLTEPLTYPGIRAVAELFKIRIQQRGDR